MVKKYLGQNWLNNNQICQEIAQLVDSKVTDHIVEIGGGRGAITKHLKKLTYYKLSVVEIDQDLITNHLLNLAINVVHDDVLKLDFDQFDGPMIICGNLPYYITSQLLLKLCLWQSQIIKGVFLIADEQAKSIVLGKNKLGIKLQYFFDISYKFKVSSLNFYPQPKIDGAVLVLKPKNRKLSLNKEIKLWQILDLAFQQKRKTLKNSLKSLVPVGYHHCLLSQRPDSCNLEDFFNLVTDLL